MNLALTVTLLNTISHLETRLAEVEKQAYTDNLTGIGNRAAFDHDLRDLRNRLTPFALIILDGNRIKHINDTYGHNTGDAAITAIADVIRHNPGRPQDKAYRWGGDEFAILVECHATEASGICSRIRKRLSAIAVPGTDLTVSASIGYSHTSHSADLFETADAELYQVKLVRRIL